MNYPWFRMYTEFAADPVVQTLAFEDQRHFVMVLCFKGNGLLDRQFPTPERRNQIICAALGLDPVAGAEAKRRLVEAALVLEDWQPRSWSKRQFSSDHDAAERKRRQRERKKTVDVVTVTTMSRDSHALDQNRTDTEQSKRVASRSRRAPESFSPDLAFAESVIPDIDASAEAAKFRDWEFKTPRSDWSAVWRTWIRNCKDTGKYTRRGGGQIWQ